MQNINSYAFYGKRALIRVDFNVPLNKETLEITDDTRIRAAVCSIKHILEKGGSVIIMSHLGRPKQGFEKRFSLKNIVSRTSELLGVDVQFAGDCISDEAIHMSSNLQPGQVMILENVRFYKGEMAGTEEFAIQLSKHGDVFVNDAFFFIS